MDTFTAALDEAQGVLKNEEATQAEVDAATANLREAVEAYNNAKQPGTQTDEDVSASRDALQELIVEAEQVERATISETGSDVDSGEEWTTQEESETFDNAISDAREVAENESAAREEIEEATILLQLAINRYNNAKQQSAQAIRSEYEVNQISLNYGYDERTEDLGDIQRGTTDLSFTTLDATLSPLISADVLSTPTVGANFIVEEGKEFKFNVRATVSSVVGTGRVGLAVYKKTNEGYEKVWDDNFDYLTLLGIPIQNKYNFRTPYFGPGEYEFVTSPDSNFNLDLISGGAFSFTDTTLREYTGNISGGETIQRQGTVIFTDGASISQVRSLTSENASPIEIEDETTVIEGKYGQLTINPATGDYTYTSSGDSASVGQLDEFEYTVVREGNEPVTNRIVILTTSESSTNVAANAENSRVANAADMPSNTSTVSTSGLTAAFNLTANLLPLRYTLLNGEIAAGTVNYNGLS